MQALVVDAANVVGSRPDGWWRDRAGAARRLHDRLVAAHLEEEVVLVLEGAARAARPPGVVRGVRTVHADGSGDDAVVEQVALRFGVRDGGTSPAPGGAPSGTESHTVVVTADRGLTARVQALGAATRAPSWLLDRLSG